MIFIFTYSLFIGVAELYKVIVNFVSRKIRSLKSEFQNRL